MSAFTIVDLTSDRVDQTASVLHAGFNDEANHWPDAWATLEEARREVLESLQPGRISRIAVIEERVVGWIGGLEAGYL